MVLHFDGLDVGGQENLTDILEASPDCVKILNREGQIRAINTAGCAFIGKPSSDLEGKAWSQFLPPTVRDAAQEAVIGAFAGHTLRLSTPCLTGGGTRHCDLTVSPLRDPKGTVAAVLAITRDVTDLVKGRLAAEQNARDVSRQAAVLRAAQAELVGARDAAQAATAAQGSFLANVSHDIRTPLHGILGLAQVMEQESPTALQRERLAVIRQSGETLMALLNDILDLSKIEAGRLELRERVFDIADALTAASAPFVDLAAQRQLAFDLDIDPTASGRWRGDELRLRQVIANLVSNAVKFTQSGGVSVKASLTSARLCVAVCDTGPGIYSADIPKLFEKFSQGRAQGAVVGGTGLGLAICRELAHLMGGELTVETTLGQGSTFTLAVPFARALAEPSAPTLEVATGARLLRILAAEDNPTNQLILRSMLAPLGVDLVMVGDGVAAVESFMADTFDLVLMDIQMPRLNGVEAAQRIRAWEGERGCRPTPIVALSANVMAHQVETYRAAGMDEAVEKPIDLSRLYAVLQTASLGRA